MGHLIWVGLEYSLRQWCDRGAGLAVAAVQHVRRMRGGAQSHLMRCSDGHFYVVKFQDNPQHTRVLANEMLATRLAQAAGLPVPATEVVEVDRWLIEHTPELRFELVHGSKAARRDCSSARALWCRRWKD